MVLRFLKLQEELRLMEGLCKINGDEKQIHQAHDYSMMHDGGDFYDEEHPYSADLDIFGEKSLFQYINRGETLFGRQALAGYLCKIDDRETIIKRQRSVESLINKLDFRQKLRAEALGSNDDSKKLSKLKSWFEEENIIKGKWLQYFPVIAFILAISFVVLQYFYFLQTWPLLVFVPTILVFRKILTPINDLHQKTGEAEDILLSYKRILSVCEDLASDDTFIKERIEILNGEKGASAAIGQFRYILSQLNVRYNVFVIFLNLLGAWDIYWVYRMEKWRSAHKEQVMNWFDIMGEIEALSSLATLSFNHPDWNKPEITQTGDLKGKELGHPLLKRGIRVSNDFDCPAEGHTKLLTGSNMAGKSTFLRTVGLNIVLANAGSVVCAHSLSTPVFSLITSMRNSDNLHDSTSSFYAELKRLRKVIQLVKSGEKVFYLLDEILKGTNSTDRHKGSRALITQLIRDRGTGIVATHDLDLGVMESESEGLIKNICLEVDIQGNELSFDYKLREGVCKSLNASILMQNMGIEL